MRADVVEDAKPSIAAPGQEKRPAGDLDRCRIARIRHIALERDRHPAGREDLAALGGEPLGLGVGEGGKAARRPGRLLKRRHRFAEALVHHMPFPHVPPFDFRSKRMTEQIQSTTSA
jgi:hypothetical protein